MSHVPFPHLKERYYTVFGIELEQAAKNSFEAAETASGSAEVRVAS